MQLPLSILSVGIIDLTALLRLMVI